MKRLVDGFNDDMHGFLSAVFAPSECTTTYGTASVPLLVVLSRLVIRGLGTSSSTDEIEVALLLIW